MDYPRIFFYAFADSATFIFFKFSQSGKAPLVILKRNISTAFYEDYRVCFCCLFYKYLLKHVLR